MRVEFVSYGPEKLATFLGSRYAETPVKSGMCQGR